MSEDAQRPSTGFHLRPHTHVGWIAVWLTAAFAVCFGGAQAAIATRGVNDANPWLSIFGLSGFALANAAGIASFVAIVRRRERGLLLLLPAVLGIIALIFILGEVLVPH